MTEEEKKAIVEIEVKRDYFEQSPEGCNWNLSFDEREVQSIDIILNLVKKQQEEIEKKDKIMDLMVDRFQWICVTPSLAKYQWKRICSEDLKICEGRLCEDCTKQYFENKIEERNKHGNNNK